MRRRPITLGRRTPARTRLGLWLGAVLACAATPALAVTLTVNSTGDANDAAAGDGSCFTGFFVEVSPGLFGPECTLRAAIEEANALAGADTIEFADSLPKVANVVEIFPASPLPAIASTILVDGYSADGYAIFDAAATPVINLGGSAAGAGAYGLVVAQSGSGSVIRGLAIFSFDAAGILLSSPVPQALTDVRIEGCHIGIWRGLFYQGNGGDGIDVRAASRTVIGRSSCSGGSCTGRRNVIAASAHHGIDLQFATFSEVAGNVIGTNPSGTTTFVPFGGATPNGEWGVRIVAGGRNTIGGSAVAGRNLVSGNASGGIQIEGSTGNFVVGNFVGTDHDGDQALGNGGPGIDLAGGPNVVGEPGAGNLVSGNANTGIQSEGPNTVHGNTVGLDVTRTLPLANGWDGITVAGSGAVIDRNAIGGNDRHGLFVEGQSHRLTTNYVGTNVAGDDLANGLNGIVVTDAQNVQIGDAGEGNVVGFNGIGIGISSADGPNFVQGNYVGTSLSGDAIPNDTSGIYVSSSSSQLIGAVGGLDNGLGNVIGQNGGNGITLAVNLAPGPGQIVVGNYIGTNANDEVLGNGSRGIRIHGTANEIGAGASAASNLLVDRANVIAYNEDGAIALSDLATDNALRGNVLYANGGAEPIDLGADGDTPNDVGDIDVGSNRLQNHPEFIQSQTAVDEITGDLEVRYRVYTNEGDAAYPLTVDFYLRTAYDSEAEVYVGSDVYPAASATLYRSVAITPEPGVLVEGLLVATATDADGNTSEFSDQLIPVPEPGALALLGSGVVALLGLGRGTAQRGRDRRPTALPGSLHRTQ